MLGLASGVFNVSFVIETALPDHAPIVTTMVSDLAVRGRPWFWVFRLCDSVSAVLLLILGVLAWIAASRGPSARQVRWWRTATILLVGFALSTLIAVLVPESCVSATCPGPASWQDGTHDAVSAVGTAAGILSALAFARAVRHRRALSLAHQAMGLAAAALGVLFVTAQFADRPANLGWPQRAQIVVMSTWFLVIGRSVDVWERRASARAPSGPPRVSQGDIGGRMTP